MGFFIFLTIPLEFVEDKQTKVPALGMARKLIDSCAEKGLLVGSVGTFGNVIRVAPPLVINEAQAYESLDIMEKAISALAIYYEYRNYRNYRSKR